MFQVTFFLTSYIIPLTLICGLYVCMLLRLWRGAHVSAESRRGKRRVTRLVLVVVGVFAICWCPIQVRYTRVNSYSVYRLEVQPAASLSELFSQGGEKSSRRVRIMDWRRCNVDISRSRHRLFTVNSVAWITTFVASQMSLGEIYRAKNFLEIPLGATPGKYTCLYMVPILYLSKRARDKEKSCKYPLETRRKIPRARNRVSSSYEKIFSKVLSRISANQEIDTLQELP